MKESLFILFQKLAPQHALSWLAGWFASNDTMWFKNFIIKHFIQFYKVDMSISEQENHTEFENFNAFFTRALKPGAREIASSDTAIASPADGEISQIGSISEDKIFQAKNHWYTVAELLGGDDKLAEKFVGGNFATIYLSPRDYHRVHMPCDGQLSQMNHIPGDLFSVNGATTKNIPSLFARNERIAAIFDTKHGPVAVIMVGAMIVGSIETVWEGQITPATKEVKQYLYKKTRSVRLKKGEEMGRFKLGSTAILLFPKGTINWDENMKAGQALSMGEKMGELTKRN